MRILSPWLIFSLAFLELFLLRLFKIFLFSSFWMAYLYLSLTNAWNICSFLILFLIYQASEEIAFFVYFFAGLTLPMTVFVLNEITGVKYFLGKIRLNCILVNFIVDRCVKAASNRLPLFAVITIITIVFCITC